MTGDRDGVLLLHGIARRAASLRRMERALRAAGFATLNLDYPARKAALDRLADGVAARAEAFCEGIGRLHIVTHSMGGLVARALVARRRPAKLGRVVMLGPPNGGSEVADALHRLGAYRRVFGPAGAQLVTRRTADLTALLGTVDYPLGVIAGDRSLYPLASRLWLKGPNDGRVTVARTTVPGMSDHLTLHATHATMMWNRTAIRQTLHFLREGRFDAAGGPSATGACDTGPCDTGPCDTKTFSRRGPAPR